MLPASHNTSRIIPVRRLSKKKQLRSAAILSSQVFKFPSLLQCCRVKKVADTFPIQPNTTQSRSLKNKSCYSQIHECIAAKVTNHNSHAACYCYSNQGYQSTCQYDGVQPIVCFGINHHFRHASVFQ